MTTRTAITIEIDDDLVGALNRFIADMGARITPAEALHAALRDWAIGHGYLPAHGAKAGRA